MRIVTSAVLLTCVCSVVFVNAESNLRAVRRHPNFRRSQKEQEESGFLPSFITRAFGGSSHGSSRQHSGTGRGQGGPRLRRHPSVGTSGTVFPRRRTSRPTRPSSAIPISSVPVLKPMKSIITPISSLAPGITKPTPYFTKTPIPSSSTFLPTPPKSLDGWLSHPTVATASPPALRTFSPEKISQKSGVCGNAVSFGIYCKTRMDQCVFDGDCPGQARCCMVGDCGNLCVKPRGKLEGANKKKRVGASSVLRRQDEEDRARTETSTTAMGLKLDDIAPST